MYVAIILCNVIIGTCAYKVFYAFKNLELLAKSQAHGIFSDCCMFFKCNSKSLSTGYFSDFGSIFFKMAIT